MSLTDPHYLILQTDQVSLGPDFFWPRALVSPPDLAPGIPLGMEEGRPVIALWGQDWWPGPWTRLREVFPQLPPHRWKLIARALPLLNWRRTHRFCGVCGQPMQDTEEPLSLWCPSCGHTEWVRITPAVIVLITRGDEVLLGHNRNHAPGVFSLLAGYIEPGESAEEAVHREVWEEARIRLRHLRFLESQPWPFPDNLMLAFRAEWAEGRAQPDGQEILELGWFSRDHLPTLPGRGSLARRLLETWQRGELGPS